MRNSPPRSVTSGAAVWAASRTPLLTRHHGDSLALEVHVWLAADVDGDAVDRAAGERIRLLARVVLGDGITAVAADAQALAGDCELAGLGLDARRADRYVAVIERQGAGRHSGRIFAVLLERRGQD